MYQGTGSSYFEALQPLNWFLPKISAWLRWRDVSISLTSGISVIMCHHVGLFGHPVWDILCFLDLDVNFLHQVREVLNSFLAVLGLCCCMHAFSRCGEQELLSSCKARTSHCGGVGL